MSQLHCVLQLRVALVCVVFLCFATQGCAGLRSLSVLQLRVALVCVVLLCLATQGCAGLRIFIVFCNSGLRWFA